MTMIYGTLTFLPMIIHWNLSNIYCITIPLAISLINLLIGYIKKDYGVMAITLTVYLGLVNILYFIFEIDFMLENKLVLSYIVLALMGWVSIKIYRPFTMDGAKGAYEKEFHKSPLFIEVNILISKIWSVSFLLNAISEIFKNPITSTITNIYAVIAIVLSAGIPKLLPEN